MHICKKSIVLVYCFFFYISAYSQAVIPAFTGYAVPAERMDSNDESTLFNRRNGLHHWSDPHQRIQYYFYIRNPGKLDLHFLTRNRTTPSQMEVTLAGKKLTVSVPKSIAFRNIYAGSWEIMQPGFYCLELSSLKKTATTTTTIADLQSLQWSGPASKDLYYNPSPRRNAASVHLRYLLSDTSKAILFYNEITIPHGLDPTGTYYMACGFARGYFGIQVNSPTERRVIFSVWDSGNESTDRARVADSNKVFLLGKGEDVIAEGFGNEGTGGHSHWVYNWKTGETYKFLVTALVDSATQTTIYSGYFLVPEIGKWKLIAAFKAPKDGKYLRNLYSFVENFEGTTGQLERKGFFSNQWIRNLSGDWKELAEATFSYDETARAGNRIDYGGGIEDFKFYLWNGGFKKGNTSMGDRYLRGSPFPHPEIDLLKNADSLAQSQKDKQLISSAIASGYLDTTGSVDGIYYKVLKEGTGRKVMVSDTIVAYYKGSLLNGEIFDQTKDHPATFPLGRLIKGWQIGLPLCREGGKIMLIIPSSLAYSIRTRSPKLPPNSVLIFEIEIVGIKR